MSNKIFLLEFLGTGTFVFAALQTSGNPILIGATLTFLLLLSMTLGINTAAFNPVFSITNLALKRTPSETFIPIIICQVLGALTAAELYKRLR